jgi:hypothetical protein
VTADVLADTAAGLWAVVEKVYAGQSRPDNDADILRALADWLDAIDDEADRLMRGMTEVSRTKQADLRRIADTLP